MPYKKMTLSDIPEIREHLYRLNPQTCDYTVGGMLMWRDYYHMEYQITDGTFYSRLFDEHGNCFYNIPIGEDICAGIENLIRKNGPVRFCTVPETLLASLARVVGECRITEQPDFADYLYDARDLMTLKGKKYNGQRNMIHQFLRENPAWSYEKIDSGNVDSVCRFLREHYKIAENATGYEIEEEQKVWEVLDHYREYGFVGSVLTSDRNIVGFSIGEPVGNTLFVHIEKANKEVKGAYQMLVRLFAQNYVSDGILYINREEDMGDPGLRASKTSYHPVKMLKKYIVEVCQ